MAFCLSIVERTRGGVVIGASIVQLWSVSPGDIARNHRPLSSLQKNFLAGILFRRLCTKPDRMGKTLPKFLLP